MKLSKSVYHNERLREVNDENLQTLSDEEFRNYYFSEDYETYFIEYAGDINAAISKLDYAKVYVTDKFFSILFVKNGMLNTLLESVPEITMVQPNAVYTLSELIVDNDISKAASIFTGNIPLNGEGVIVGVIGTGIDYLNPRFMNERGESRIVSIWDQTIETGPTPAYFPYGTVYNKEEIDKAIRANIIGGAPYDIVPHRDEVGNGTAIAGLIGGRNLGGDDKLKSIAPKCEFAVVKLTKPKESTLRFAGVVKEVNNIYETLDVATAIRYLSLLQKTLNRPMVLYLSLGTNFGGRNGDTILERYIDNLASRNDFFIVTETGNQGTGVTHTSGTIGGTGETSDILVNVAPLQTLLNLSIYIRSQDILSISITAPDGSTLKSIPITSNIERMKYFNVEENNISIEYSARETISGYLFLDILIKNTVEGTWKVSLQGVDIVNGTYNAWIPQSELLEGDTRFLNPDPRTTLLTPCGASNIMATSYYNQIDNTVVEKSGKGFPFRSAIEPTVTNGGINLLTVGLNNSLILGTGGAVAGAILAGAVALIFQWGLSQGNISGFYNSRIRYIIIASTVKDEDKIYPNIEWGFGKLSFELLYEVLTALSTTNRNYETSSKENRKSYLYINIPVEILKRMKF